MTPGGGKIDHRDRRLSKERALLTKRIASHVAQLGVRAPVTYALPDASLKALLSVSAAVALGDAQALAAALDGDPAKGSLRALADALQAEERGGVAALWSGVDGKSCLAVLPGKR